MFTSSTYIFIILSCEVQTIEYFQRLLFNYSMHPWLWWNIYNVLYIIIITEQKNLKSHIEKATKTRNTIMKLFIVDSGLYLFHSQYFRKRKTRLRDALSSPGHICLLSYADFTFHSKQIQLFRDIYIFTSARHQGTCMDIKEI